MAGLRGKMWCQDLPNRKGEGKIILVVVKSRDLVQYTLSVAKVMASDDWGTRKQELRLWELVLM
jgi:hypothetical protein